MISRREKTLMHVYAGAARLSDQEYREILADRTGKRSCADRQFTHADVDSCLSALEAVLFDRVAQGHCPDPRGRSRWIRAERYFRDRLARSNSGCAQPRQLYRLHQLWTQLGEFLDDARCSPDYLARLIHRAIGRVAAPDDLTYAEAQFVLDALSDRLRHALRSARASETAQNFPPF